MSDEARRLQFDDRDAATRIGHFWDAVVAETAAEPEIAADLAEFETIVRRLHQTAPDPAPMQVHDGIRALLAAQPAWLTQETVPFDASAVRVSPNGYRPNPVVDGDASPRPNPIRRYWPVAELVGLAAAVLILLYFAYSDYQTADDPTPTPAPTQPTVVPTPAVGDWPMLGGGPARTGGTDRAIPASEPTLTWVAALPTGVRYPVAAGDAVYVSNGGILVALNAPDGTERWRFDLGVVPSVAGASPPAVVGGAVYIAAHDGTVFALDAATGQTTWTHETGGTNSTGLAVADGVVYVGTTEGDLDALDAATGEPRWSYPTGPISISSPVVADGVVYVGAGGNKLFALNAASGTVLWQVPVKAGMQSVGVGDGIAVASGVNTSSAVLLIAVDAASSAIRWQGRNAADLPPAIVGGTVYVVGGGAVSALDATAGTQRWVVDAKLKVVDVAVIGSAIALCRKDGTVIVINRDSGKEAWRITTGGAGTGIAVGVSVMYVAHSDGTVAAYD